MRDAHTYSAIALWQLISYHLDWREGKKSYGIVARFPRYLSSQIYVHKYLVVNYYVKTSCQADRGLFTTPYSRLIRQENTYTLKITIHLRPEREHRQCGWCSQLHAHTTTIQDPAS